METLTPVTNQYLFEQAHSDAHDALTLLNGAQLPLNRADLSALTNLIGAITRMHACHLHS